LGSAINVGHSGAAGELALVNCYAGILKHELQDPRSSIIAPGKFPLARGIECLIREVHAGIGRDGHEAAKFLIS